MQLDHDPVFAHLVDLSPVSTHTYVGAAGPEASGRTFGGQFLAQGLAAAYRSVDGDRRAHSLHAYFVRAGEVAEPTIYEVELIRDGRSFAARSVVGRQQGKEVVRLMLSFQVAEGGLDYQPGKRYPIESLPSPDEVATTYNDVAHQHADIGPGPWEGDTRPMDIRYINPPTAPEGVPVIEPQLMWLRITGPVPAGQASHDAGLAYLADSTLVDHVALPHGHRWHDARLTGTSLDHAMWFHRPTQVDRWVLYDQRVEHTGGARGLVTGHFYTTSGELVATCSQEGLMRWTAGPAS